MFCGDMMLVFEEGEREEEEVEEAETLLILSDGVGNLTAIENSWLCLRK